MNVYDFDGTIYDGDSTKDFYIYCLKNNIHVIKVFPRQVKAMLQYKFHLISKDKFKEVFFSFLSLIDEIDDCIKKFSVHKQYKIKKWYLQQKKEDDVIISASPAFLVEAICLQCGIKNVIASDIDKKTGKLNTPNCSGKEKVSRFKDRYSLKLIDQFYSDSKIDEPLAKWAKESFLVRKNSIKPWIK